jgi:probable DNA metabolism protein
MVLFVCKDSVDGIFSGIYDAWASRLGHQNVGLRIAGSAELELFAEYLEVMPDSVKAAKVADTIRRKMGETAYEHIYQAALSYDEKKADSIYRVLTVGLSKHTEPYLAHHLMDRLQDPDVRYVFQLSRRTGREANRYIEFVRFRELENGVLFSEIKAEAQILPLIGGHFADRFPNEDFMIYDHGHGDALVHPAGKAWLIWKSADPQPFLHQAYSSTELEMQQLWRRFCDSISISERENPGLQMQFWPLKYRKWMTEGERF